MTMVKTLNFFDAKGHIEEKGIKDKVFRSEDGKSSFKVDTEGNIVDVKVKDMNDEFVIYEIGVEEFIKKEEESKEKFFSKYMPTQSEVKEMTFEDLVELFENTKDIKWEPEFKYDTKTITDSKKKYKVMSLNRGEIVGLELEERIFEEVVINNIKDSVKDKKEVVDRIFSIMREDYTEDYFTNKVYFVESLVTLVNLSHK